MSLGNDKLQERTGQIRDAVGWLSGHDRREQAEDSIHSLWTGPNGE